MESDEKMSLGDISQTPFSDKDMKRYHPKTNIITYEDLSKANSIEDILPKKKDAVILLFEREPNIGHWVALLREDKTIIYFDPYGYRPDKFLQYTPQNLRKLLSQDTPHLTVLLNKAVDDGAKVIFNEFSFQNRSKNGLATCGRWVVRLIEYFQRKRKPTLEGFYKTIKKLSKSHGLTFDLTISKLTP
jgi:hypothetical protein